VSVLDPVQVAALDFARDKRGVGWFIEQGMGKSLCALAEFSLYATMGDATQMLIICPNTFKRGWIDEIEKHGFDFNAHIFQSAKRVLAATWMAVHSNRPRVLIINYEAVRMAHILASLTTWLRQGPTYLVIDESIQIKGNSSLQTKAVHKLAPLAKMVRILTGRPQTQGPHDLWGQLRAIGLFSERNFVAFRGAFCIMGGWEQKEVVGAKNTDVLAEIMSPWVFQAKKRDWLPELPRKDSTIRDYQMSDEQLSQYRSMEEKFLLEIEKGYVTVDVAIAKFEKLAQIQTGFIYDENGDVHELVGPDQNPRLDLLLQLLEEEVTGKVCVVYRHRAILSVLQQTLAAWNPAWIKGGMTADEVGEQKARFNEDPRCRIILLQAEASKYGHTLLGGPGPDDLCRTMIFFENSYSADTRDQIEDRIHRRGQTGERVL
jgi:SNF2 family DNA or RNA helicase